jgi:hypothetical protein
MKLLLEYPANVRDLLSVLEIPWLDQIDFGHIEQIRTTFIRRDFRHLESDLILTAPLAGPGRSRRKLLIYILIEHQSKPDRWMPCVWSIPNPKFSAISYGGGPGHAACRTARGYCRSSPWCSTRDCGAGRRSAPWPT